MSNKKEVGTDMETSGNFTKSICINDVVPYIETQIKLTTQFVKEKKRSSVICLSGPPGIGKSDIMEQICEKNRWALNVYYMSTSQLEALTGIPKIDVINYDFQKWLSTTIESMKLLGDNNDFCYMLQSLLHLDNKKYVESFLKEIPSFQPKKPSASTEWSLPDIMAFRNIKYVPKNYNYDDDTMVLFLDDIHLVNKTMQSYLFQLLTYRSINNHQLPDNVVIMMAGNRSNDHAGFQQMLAPITNRICFLDVHSNVDSWTDNFAIPYGVRTDIISFLQHYETSFMSTPLENQAWASPRSWTYASDYVEKFEKIYGGIKQHEIYNCIKGHVGDDHAGEFIKFKTLMLKHDAPAILDGRKHVKYDGMSQIDLYALLSTCVDETLKRMRLHMKKTETTKFVLKKEFEPQCLILQDIIDEVFDRSSVIVPPPLSILTKGERAMGSVSLTKRILDQCKNRSRIAEFIN